MDAIDTGDYARSLHVPLIQISQDAHHGDYDYKQRANQDKDTGLCPNSSDSDDELESHALIPELSTMRKRSMSIRSVASTHGEVPKDAAEVLVGVSSVSASSFTFTNFIIQPANPANLPIACLQSGLIAFPLLVTVFGVINCFTCDLLVDAIDIVGQANAVGFAELLSHRFGRVGWYAGALSVIFANFGSLVFTIILIGDMLTPLIGLATGNAILCAHWVWNVGVAVVFLCPMAFIKNMSQLDEASQVAVVILIMLVLSLIGFGVFLIIEPHQRSHFGESTYHDQCTRKEQFNDPGDKYLILPQSLTFFSALSNLAFSFNAQANVFPLYAELKDRTPNKMKSVNRRAMVMSGVIFILAGVFGYVAFLDATKGNCVKNFPVLEPFGYFMDAVRFLLAVSLVTSYPLTLWECRSHLEQMIAKDSDSAKVQEYKRLGMSFLLIVISTAIAVLAKDVSVVFNFFGSTACPMLMFTLPTLNHLKLHRPRVAQRFFPLLGRINWENGKDTCALLVFFGSLIIIPLALYSWAVSL